MKIVFAVLALFALSVPAFADGGGVFFNRARSRSVSFNRARSRSVSFNVQRNVVKQQVVKQVQVQQVVKQVEVVKQVKVAQIVVPVQQVVKVQAFAYAAPAYAPCYAPTFVPTYTVPLAPVYYGPSAPSSLERAVRELAEQQKELSQRQDQILRQLSK